MTAETIPPLLGYADRLSVRPGETVGVKVSCTLPDTFNASLVRIISADPNPSGPGIIEEPVPAALDGDYPARVQIFTPGSCAAVSLKKGVPLPASMTVSAMIWPTRPGHSEQAVISFSAQNVPQSWFVLGIDDTGHGFCRVVMDDGSTAQATLLAPLRERKWCHLWVNIDEENGQLIVGSHSEGRGENNITTLTGRITEKRSKPGEILIAAARAEGRSFHFNGKIDSPTIYDRYVDHTAILDENNKLEKYLFARWDFGIGVNTTQIHDIGPHSLNGSLINYPARAMTGWNWDGSEMCWRHAPSQYGAIHFHDDDIYDFNWETDFSFEIPDNLKSGVYGIRLTHGDYTDTVPLVICPPRGQQSARLCVLISTFTWTVYGNHARPDYNTTWQEKIANWNAYPWNPAEFRDYGLSTYNFHSDGSGICHASYLRPLFNLRPGYLTFGASQCSGLRHYQADSHLTAWLEAKGHDYEVITVELLHEEGVEVLAPYAAVTTGSHPEYHTLESLDALEAYRDQGGNLAYLGGNGFYWRVSLHPEDKGLVEIRRAEGGIRAWAAEPGEYYSAMDGTYGGLWRRNGRPPQRLAGVGFSAQGTFSGSYYRRTPESYDQKYSWMFDGIEDETLGDFGLCGNGAAGFELDRVDYRLGSPENTAILASSENHDDSFVLVPEEHLTHITNWPGAPKEQLIRADLAYIETETGGAIFSTGSITFCGSLPTNDFRNNISTLLDNVFHRFLID